MKLNLSYNSSTKFETTHITIFFSLSVFSFFLSLFCVKCSPLCYILQPTANPPYKFTRSHIILYSVIMSQTDWQITKRMICLFSIQFAVVSVQKSEFPFVLFYDLIGISDQTFQRTGLGFMHPISS